MVFKQSEQAFSVCELDQVAYEPWRQLEISGELASFPEILPPKPEKLATTDGRPNIFRNNHLDDAPVVILGGKSPDVHECGVGLSDRIGNMNEVVQSDHSKRPLVDDNCSFASKRSKQFEPIVQMVSPELAYNTPGSPSDEEDTPVDPYCMTNTFPFYFEGYCWAGQLDQSRETFSTSLDCDPRKTVPLGPNHQAVLPKWRFNGLKNYPGHTVDPSALTEATPSLHDSVKADEDGSGKMTGTCIMPMPDTANLVLHAGILRHKMDCNCPDKRSVRCVKQHITEVRENLEKELGHDRFVDLGFCDMGECVTEKWSEEDEHLFHEVVSSNPASLGKNFWDNLPNAFPSLSSKDLVSYYFNVFMLRKRGKQNRSDPLNVDSDDDEWQENDGVHHCMEEEGSVIESLTDQDAICEKDSNKDVDIDDDIEHDEFDGFAVDIDSGGRMSSNLAHTSEGAQNCLDEHEVQDDSCTSFETQNNGVDFTGGSLDIAGNQHGFSTGYENLPKNESFGAIDHGFVEGHCAPKTWDISTYKNGGQKEEFLSTCIIVEEVFGKEGWKSRTMNGHGFSHP